MALFVVAIVGVIVAQTWLDWQHVNKDWVLPDWAKGAALAGVLAISLTAIASLASVWIQDPTAQWGGGFTSRIPWPELGFVLCMMGIVVGCVWKKRLRMMLLLTGILVAVFWLGMALSS